MSRYNEQLAQAHQEMLQAQANPKKAKAPTLPEVEEPIEEPKTPFARFVSWLKAAL